MDGLTRAPRLTFGPDRRATIAVLAGAAVAAFVAAFAVSAGDAPGRLLAGVAALVLVSYAVSDLVFTPRLVASGEGLVVRSPAVRATLAWAAVEEVRADSRVRFGLRSTALEIDAGETLVVLTRRALGARPEDVAALLTALRPVGPV